MNETLKFNIAAPLRNGGNFSDRQLARENNALKAKFAKRKNTL